MNEENLVALLQDIKTDLAVVKSQLDRFADHEDRIRELERARWSSAWVTALVASGLTSVVITVLIKVVTNGN